MRRSISAWPARLMPHRAVEAQPPARRAPPALPTAAPEPCRAGSAISASCHRHASCRQSWACNSTSKSKLGVAQGLFRVRGAGGVHDQRVAAADQRAARLWARLRRSVVAATDSAPTARRRSGARLPTSATVGWELDVCHRITLRGQERRHVDRRAASVAERLAASAGRRRQQHAVLQRRADVARGPPCARAAMKALVDAAMERLRDSASVSTPPGVCSCNALVGHAHQPVAQGRCRRPART
jgi:hypothetical protein